MKQLIEQLEQLDQEVQVKQYYMTIEGYDSKIRIDQTFDPTLIEGTGGRGLRAFRKLFRKNKVAPIMKEQMHNDEITFNGVKATFEDCPMEERERFLEGLSKLTNEYVRRYLGK